MGYLPAAKRNRELNTLALANKAPDVLDFELDVVFFGPRAHLDFLDRRGRRMALGVMGLLLLRVTVLVEVGDPADRGLGRRRDLDQVQAAAFGHADRLAGAQDADLAAVDVDYPDFGRRGSAWLTRIAGSRGGGVRKSLRINHLRRHLSRLAADDRRISGNSPFESFRSAAGATG